MFALFPRSTTRSSPPAMPNKGNIAKNTKTNPLFIDGRASRKFWASRRTALFCRAPAAREQFENPLGDNVRADHADRKRRWRDWPHQARFAQAWKKN